MKMFQKNKILLLAVILSCFVMPEKADALDTYPKLASYYLNTFGEQQYGELLKFDLLIVQPEMSFLNAGFFQDYRKQKKGGLLISYTYPAMVTDYNPDKSINLREYMFSNVNNNNWWLTDCNKNRLEIWPGIYAVNVTNKDWQNLNVNYLKNMIDIDKWDGIMFDTVDTSIERYNQNGGIDIDNDGDDDDRNQTNAEWQRGMAELFKKTRQSIGNKIIMINGASIDAYQPDINGRMFETFPTPWEGDWSNIMNKYVKALPNKNVKPNVYVINGNTNNSGDSRDYQKMRFGLTSTLLGDGYFSFDYGDKDHGQTWWYDEYDVKLGRARSSAYNLLEKTNGTIKEGLWRRDFENGISLVNSTNSTQKYVFNKEEFEKIKGTQDKTVNDGSKVNWVKLAPKDGLLLLNINTEITGSSYANGSFFRSFNDKGKQTRNGFFAYKDAYPGDVQIMVTDIDNDNSDEAVVNGKGAISFYKNGKRSIVINPYGANFKGDISFAIGNLNGDSTGEIITGAGKGGGPQIRIFSNEGKVLSQGFFAFDKKSRGGVNVASGDINNDGKDEIIAGAGSGISPKVGIFDKNGKALGEFLAYDKNFRGGVSVAVGDVNNDGIAEIVTGPGAGLSPLVKIFRKDGKLIGQFLAFDKTVNDGIKVIVEDINNDGTDEILVSTTEFIN